MSIVTEQLDAIRTPLIICCSSADTVIERWNVLEPFDERVYAYSDYIAHEMTELISAYRQNSRIKMDWQDAGPYHFPFDTSHFENEVRKNYTENDEKTRFYYKRYINEEIDEFLQKISKYKNWLTNYDSFVQRGVIKNYDLDYLESGIVEEILGSSKNYTRKGLVDLFARELDLFVNTLEKIKSIIDRFDRIFSDNAIDNLQKEPGPKFQWKGDKTDLAELVWALAKSGRINDTSNGQLVTQKELTHQFETLFGLTLDVTGLMKGRMKTYKATSDCNTFTKTLFD